MKLRCLRDGILFAFLQEQNSKGAFIDKTDWGLEIQTGINFQSKDHGAFDRALEIGRWARVLLIGPECKEVKVGDYVCLEPQMWSNGFDHDGIQIRKSDESKIMIISKEKPNVNI